MIRKHGLGSSISVPIATSSKRGALRPTPPPRIFFDPKIISLIEKLAADLAHGIKFIEAQHERARLLDKLAISEANHRALFENNHVVMLLVDPATSRIEDANPAAARFYGWPRTTFIGKSIHEINTATSEDIARAQRQASESDHAEFRFQHRLADGSVREVEVHSGPVLIDGRRLLFSVVLDVTERVQSVARLHLLQTAIEAAPSAIVITDPVGHIQWANPAFTQLTGYNLAKIADAPRPSCAPANRTRPSTRTCGKPSPTGASGAATCKTCAPMAPSTGRTWSSPPSSRPRAPSCTTSPSNAISPPRRNWRQQLIRTQRLESIGLLAGGIAHDLNNVLAPILMATDLFKLRFTDPVDQARLDIIHKSAQRGAGIVRQVLTFAGAWMASVCSSSPAISLKRSAACSTRPSLATSRSAARFRTSCRASSAMPPSFTRSYSTWA